MIRAALAAGTLKPGMSILDASSGNMACSIALLARILNHRATLVVSSKLTDDKRNYLRYYGASIVQIGDFTIDGNRYCRELVKSDDGQYLFLDQLHNWANPQAHLESTGPEILGSVPDVSMIVGSLGSGGTLYGTALYAKRQSASVSIVAVQAASGSRIPGVGGFDDGDYVTPFIEKGRRDCLFDHTYLASERDAMRRTAELRDEGIFVGLQTGAVLHAAIDIATSLSASGNIVIISGDSGWKSLSKLLGQAPAFRNEDHPSIDIDCTN